MTKTLLDSLMLLCCVCALVAGNDCHATQYIAVEIETTTPLYPDEYIVASTHNFGGRINYTSLERGPSGFRRFFYDCPVAENSVHILYVRAFTKLGYPISSFDTLMLDARPKHTYFFTIRPLRGTHSTQLAGKHITLNIDYNIDVDGDGLGSAQELEHRTNAWSADTDHDCLPAPVDIFGTNILIAIEGQPAYVLN